MFSVETELMVYLEFAFLQDAEVIRAEIIALPIVKVIGLQCFIIYLLLFFPQRHFKWKK